MELEYRQMDKEEEDDGRWQMEDGRWRATKRKRRKSEVTSQLQQPISALQLLPSASSSLPSLLYKMDLTLVHQMLQFHLAYSVWTKSAFSDLFHYSN